MWGLYLDSKAFEDGLFHAVVQYKIDNSKALVISPKANYELDIKESGSCRHLSGLFMGNRSRLATIPI